MHEVEMPATFYRRYGKRACDVVLALTVLLVAGWLMLLIAAAVRLKLGRPVLFRQPRPGFRERLFDLWKFRTMNDARDERGAPLPDQQRLTAFGMFLRKSSLDELPEILNVLRGEMSFVGPRPLLSEYLPYYREEERVRAWVRPGITGLAQVSGRNLLTWEERFRLDVEYVRTLSPGTDLRIIMSTVAALFRRNEIRIGDDNPIPNLDVERRGKMRGER